LSNEHVWLEQAIGKILTYMETICRQHLHQVVASKFQTTATEASKVYWQVKREQIEE
jgi:hypothetical protein